MMTVMGNMLLVTLLLEEQVGRGKGEDRDYAWESENEDENEDKDEFEDNGENGDDNAD